MIIRPSVHLTYTEAIKLHLVTEILLVHHMVDHTSLEKPAAKLLGGITCAHLALVQQQVNHLLPKETVCVRPQTVLAAADQLAFPPHHHLSDLEAPALDTARVFFRVGFGLLTIARATDTKHCVNNALVHKGERTRGLPLV